MQYGRIGEIAERYARQDSRIRLVRRTELLSQVQNYNRALAEISDASRYCKIVQADDCIFPDCLKLMVQAFQRSDSIGLVSSYDLKGDTVRGSSFPHHLAVLSGKDMGRLYFRTGVYVFGSPTTVMFRSSLVRSQQPFYDESLLHEDTEKCLQILQSWDFAFVPQVLSFLRVGNEGISSAVKNFGPGALDHYIIVRRYALAFLDAPEASQVTKQAKRDYYRQLARAAIRLRGAAFWKYHREGLKTLGESLDRSCLMLQILLNCSGWQRIPV